MEGAGLLFFFFQSSKREGQSLFSWDLTLLALAPRATLRRAVFDTLRIRFQVKMFFLR